MRPLLRAGHLIPVSVSVLTPILGVWTKADYKGIAEASAFIGYQAQQFALTYR